MMQRYEMFAHAEGQLTAEEAKHGRWAMYSDAHALKCGISG